MKALLGLVLVGGVVGVAAASSPLSPGSPSVASAAPGEMFAPPRVLWQFGHITTLTRKGTRYELRFDPAFWLSGLTANRAAEEDGAIRPGEGVPNDYWIRDERKRGLTYRVAARARVTVLTFSATHGIRSTRIAVSELAQIVRGRNPRGRRLFSSGKLDLWISVALDTVRSIDEQYRP